jgi:hypothetical protein
MMDSVFKHVVDLSAPNGITYLFCGEVLHFAEQAGQLCVWARTADAKTRYVKLVVTGMPFDGHGLKHIGSVITDGGYFVVHAFSS